MLAACRGFRAAILTPSSLALIGAIYPKEERNRAIGVWAAASALTTAGGPVLGGWLTENFGWQWVFAINPPLALVAVALLWSMRRPISMRRGNSMWWVPQFWPARLARWPGP